MHGLAKLMTDDIARVYQQFIAFSCKIANSFVVKQSLVPIFVTDSTFKAALNSLLTIFIRKVFFTFSSSHSNVAS